MTTRETPALRWLATEWEAAIDSATLRDDAATFAGIVGDRRHRARGGYHLSRQDQPKPGNYSVVRVDDRAGCGPDDAAAAIDMTYARTADLAATHERLRQVWRQRGSHPAARYLNAFNGWDGTGSPGRYDLVSGAVSTADDSHRWHIHLEIRRRWVTDMDAMRTILAALTGGDDMELSDKVGERTPHGGRTVGDVLADLAALRGVLVGESVDPARVPEAAPLRDVVAAARRVLAAPDVQPWTVTITAEQLEQLREHLDDVLRRELGDLVEARLRLVLGGLDGATPGVGS